MADFDPRPVTEEIFSLLSDGHNGPVNKTVAMLMVDRIIERRFHDAAVREAENRTNNYIGLEVQNERLFEEISMLRDRPPLSFPNE